MFTVFLKGPGSDRVSPFHVVMTLSVGQRILLACLLEFQARIKPGSCDRTDRVGIKSQVTTDLPGARPTVPQMNGDGIIGVARQNPDGSLQLAALVMQLDPFFICQP